MSSIAYTREFNERQDYRDIDLNLRVNPFNGDIRTLSTRQSIKQSVINLIRIRFYEKWFRPDIGNFSAGALFENTADIYISTLQRSIFNVLRKYEPRIDLEIESIKVSNVDASDRNELNIRIEYTIIGLNRREEVEFAVTRIL